MNHEYPHGRCKDAETMTELARAVCKAVRDGHYHLAAIGCADLLAALLRSYQTPKQPGPGG